MSERVAKSRNLGLEALGEKRRKQIREIPTQIQKSCPRRKDTVVKFIKPQAKGYGVKAH
jgi:hypothetical protein